MTEEEAKGKWCPFVRAVTGTVSENGTSHAMQPAINRIVEGEKYAWPKGAGCIASACMAWRIVRRNHHPRPVDDTHTVTTGYCGLAGSPQ